MSSFDRQDTQANVKSTPLEWTKIMEYTAAKNIKINRRRPTRTRLNLCISGYTLFQNPDTHKLNLKPLLKYVRKNGIRKLDLEALNCGIHENIYLEDFKKSFEKFDPEKFGAYIRAETYCRLNNLLTTLPYVTRNHSEMKIIICNILEEKFTAKEKRWDFDNSRGD